MWNWKWMRGIGIVCLLGAPLAVAEPPCTGHVEVPVNPARERAQRIMASAHLVSIDDSRIATVARTLAQLRFPMSPPTWDFFPYPGSEATFDRMFRMFLIVDSINYQYFHGQEDRQFSDGTMAGAGLA